MTAAAPLGPASLSMILAMIEQASGSRFNYRDGVIGLLSQPDRSARADVQHNGQLVRIRPAESALAVREALTEHRDGDWMVLLTDRSDEDLGEGIRAHLVWNRLRRPDPWGAVRHRFKATGIDPTLTAGADNRDLATALLAATPKQGWPAAPAGVLTRSHALGSLAQERLGLTGDVPDVITVLRWSVPPTAVTALADLRSQFGDVLADATLDWLAESTGVVSIPVRALLARGDVTDLVPVGLVLNVLTDEAVLSAEERHLAQLGLVRLESLWGAATPSPAVLVTLGAAAAAVVAELADDERQAAHVNRVLNRAEALLEQTQTTQLAIHSDLLRRGFRDRLARLAEALRRGTRELTPDRSDTAAASAAIESAWARASHHRLGRSSSAEILAFQAAVRLWRWLQIPALPTTAMVAERARHHLDHDGWADAAINDAATGVDDQNLSEALRFVVESALARRDTAERAFATALAAATARDDGAADGRLEDPAGPVWLAEGLLPRVVLPMARKAPVLLLVMDGMSAAAATEILDDATERLDWVEAALAGSQRRSAALSALPSLTEVSRASMLCGRLTRGQQDVEQSGYAELTGKSAKINATLFHKKGVDTTAPGALVADGVGAALDDTTGHPLVTIVLNTIDDALDRSDAAGTVWTADAVKHLEPLLARARSTGRTVVVTADHGHVVERRTGTQRAYPAVTSGRSRMPSGAVGPDEVEVHGRRVLNEQGRAVLAVSEGLRYGPLKAGYHGGASAAEVVVPVAVLLPDQNSNPLGLALLPPQQPRWWSVAGDVGSPPAAAERGRPGIPKQSAVLGRSLPDREPTLFDAATVPAPRAGGVSLGQAVVGTEVFRYQRSLAARVVVSDEQVASLVDALAVAAAARLPVPAAAAVLGVSEVRVRGALAQVQQLLNVEGYAVLALDIDGRTVLLDVGLLREQFEVG